MVTHTTRAIAATARWMNETSSARCERLHAHLAQEGIPHGEEAVGTQRLWLRWTSWNEMIAGGRGELIHVVEHPCFSSMHHGVDNSDALGS